MNYKIEIYMDCGEKIFLNGVCSEDKDLFNEKLNDELETIFMNDMYKIYKKHISFVKFS